MYKLQNALRLASVIVHCDVDEVKEDYTEEIRLLLNTMLDKVNLNYFILLLIYLYIFSHTNVINDYNYYIYLSKY